MTFSQLDNTELIANLMGVRGDAVESALLFPVTAKYVNFISLVSGLMVVI